MSQVRIVSLVPSSTETLLSLGAHVIACTRFCEQPGIAHVGGTKNPDIDAIALLKPDVVVMDREENRREDAEALTDRGLRTYVSDVRTLSHAIDVVCELARLAEVGLVPSELPLATAYRGLTAFVPIWRRPWMTINGSTYGASILEHVGVKLVTVHYDATYPDVSLDEILGLSPNVVLVPSEPYEFTDNHLVELEAVFGATVPIVRLDGQDLFWWGSRTTGAIRRLTEALGGIVVPATLG